VRTARADGVLKLPRAFEFNLGSSGECVCQLIRRHRLPVTLRNADLQHVAMLYLIVIGVRGEGVGPLLAEGCRPCDPDRPFGSARLKQRKSPAT
jgi:hypothetical protein